MGVMAALEGSAQLADGAYPVADAPAGDDGSRCGGVEVETKNGRTAEGVARCAADVPQTGCTAAEDDSTEDEMTSERGEHIDDESDSPKTFARGQTSSDVDWSDSPFARELSEVRNLENWISEELGRIGQQGLVATLAKVLTSLTTLGPKRHRATVFHCASVPKVTIQDYLARVAKYYNCSDACLVLSMIYVDRLLQIHQDFVVSGLNIHRLMAVSVMVAAKFHDDTFYANEYYAKVAGIRVGEFNRLEETFLVMLRWRLHVSPGEYEGYFGYLGGSAHPSRATSLPIESPLA
mmetsp:Transcript_75362/g.218872  ORF Transcript_75362/g.218872 Transcript_75362/m.218872 type:complete len:293 (-) Transcript_75362:20-898(-)